MSTVSTPASGPLPTAPKSAFTAFGKKLEDMISKEYQEIQDELILADQKKDSLYSLVSLAVWLWFSMILSIVIVMMNIVQTSSQEHWKDHVWFENWWWK